MNHEFDTVHEADPLGRRHLDRIEIFVGVLGTLSSLVAFFWGAGIGLGWLLGWGVCQLNVAVIRRLMVRIFRAGAFSRISLLLLMAKSMAVLVGIWLLLSYLPADLYGFVGGFTFTLAGLVSGSVIFAPRPKGSSRNEPLGSNASKHESSASADSARSGSEPDDD